MARRSNFGASARVHRDRARAMAQELESILVSTASIRLAGPRTTRWAFALAEARAQLELAVRNVRGQSHNALLSRALAEQERLQALLSGGFSRLAAFDLSAAFAGIFNGGGFPQVPGRVGDWTTTTAGRHRFTRTHDGGIQVAGNFASGVGWDLYIGPATTVAQAAGRIKTELDVRADTAADRVYLLAVARQVVAQFPHLDWSRIQMRLS